MKFDENDLSSIIQACGANSHPAQQVLVSQFYGYATTICRLYAGSEEEMEEMVNDGFLKVLNNIQKYDSTKPFKSWFRAILVNCCIDYYRKNAGRNNIISLDQLDDADIDADIISKMTADELLLLVQRLPDACRVVFTLYVMEGYNHREIGELLGIQEGTSKSNLRDARIKLKKLILMEYGENFTVSYIKNTKP